MIYYVDLFCGAGGVSTGIARAGSKVLICINHDEIAIASHFANHPDVIHAVEDIRKFNLAPLVALINKIRAEDPEAIICLWASVECTHFSKAKGGKSRDPDSRTLAEHILRYIEAINPDYIDVENVVEFLSWGPLRIACKKSYEDRSELKMRKLKDGTWDYCFIPFDRKNGRDYIKWVKSIVNGHGYDYEYRVLNAADFGAYTSRERYFGQFKRPDLPFTWPEPTHSKKPIDGGMFGSLEKWKPVKDVLNLNDLGKSIFTRKKPYAENTLRRLYAGLVKHVKKAQVDSFVAKYYGSGDNVSGIDDPSGTLTTKDRMMLANVIWVDKQYRSEYNHQSIDSPAGTIPCNDKHVLAVAEFAEESQFHIMNPQFNSKGGNMEDPCFTLIARMDKAPPILVGATPGNGQIVIYETDSPMTQKIKFFMVEHGIIDIKTRMFKIDELLRIQGFGDGYVLKGTKADMKRFIGNSVEVNLAQKKAESRKRALKSIQKRVRKKDLLLLV